MKIIKRLCAAVLSSVILLTSADLSAFAVHSVRELPNMHSEDDSIISDSNEYLPLIDENDIAEYDNSASEINDVFKPDISDEQVISDSVNNFSKHNDSEDKNSSEDEFVYEEEVLVAPEDEFVYEEEILSVPEESEKVDNSSETDIIEEPDYIENSPIDLSEYDFDDVITADTIINESITISGQTVLYEGNLTIDANVTLSNESLIIFAGTINVNSGCIVLNDNCQMISLEDFRIQSKNEDGSFGKTTGYVKLHSGTKLKVYGDFYTESTAYEYFGYGNSSNPAIFELHGNFKQIGTDTYYIHDNIANIKTVFAGDSEQHISLDKLGSSADLGRIEVLNAEQTIYLDTPMYRLYPLNDFYICKRRLKGFVSRNKQDFVSRKLLNIVQNGSQDIAKINMKISDRILEKITIRNFGNEYCNVCESTMSCEYSAIRKQIAKGKNIVICNQNMLVSHLINSNCSQGIFNENCSAYIVDETHNLESKFRDAFFVSHSRKDLINKLNSYSKMVSSEKLKFAKRLTGGMCKTVQRLYTELNRQVHQQQRGMDEGASAFFFKRTKEVLINANDLYRKVERFEKNTEVLNPDVKRFIEEIISPDSDNIMWIENGENIRLCMAAFRKKQCDSDISDYFMQSKWNTHGKIRVFSQ